MRNPFRSEAEAFSFVLVCVALFAAVAVAGDLRRRLGRARRLRRPGRWAVAFYVKGEPKPPAQPVCSRSTATGGRSSSSRTRRSRAARSGARSSSGRGAGPTCSSSARRSTRRSVTGRPTRTARGRRRNAGSPSRSWPSRRRAWRRAARSGTPTRCRRWTTRSVTFGADEIIISTHPPGRSNWLEKEVIGRAGERYPVPITHVVVDLEQERAGAPLWFLSIAPRLSR